MKTLLQSSAALAMSFSVAAFSLPGQAATVKGRGWDSWDGISSARALAIHACSVGARNRYPTWAYAAENTEMYSACMARRGQKG